MWHVFLNVYLQCDFSCRLFKYIFFFKLLTIQQQARLILIRLELIWDGVREATRRRDHVNVWIWYAYDWIAIYIKFAVRSSRCYKPINISKWKLLTYIFSKLQVAHDQFAGSGATSATHFSQPWLWLNHILGIPELDLWNGGTDA